MTTENEEYGRGEVQPPLGQMTATEVLAREKEVALAFKAMAELEMSKFVDMVLSYIERKNKEKEANQKVTSDKFEPVIKNNIVHGIELDSVTNGVDNLVCYVCNKKIWFMKNYYRAPKIQRNFCGWDCFTEFREAYQHMEVK